MVPMRYNRGLKSAWSLHARPTMDARYAVLLTPPKPSGPTQLLFYKQNTSISPLFATLTSRPQIAENAATLSPFPATLTASSPVTPVFATLTKNAGVSLPLFPFWISPLVTPHSPLPPGETHHLSCLSPPGSPKRKTPSFLFNSLRTVLQLRGRGRDPLI